jgi:site-specific DNA recombinase
MPPQKPRQTPDRRRKRALLYLRVSTRDQVNTDYNPEGISLPAQRVAGERKAAELGADVVDEYIEPGKTATTIDMRPVFLDMVARIKARQDVDYIIVYHFNRMFRNAIDAAITKRDLARYGIRIVSTVVDLGEGPEADMVEMILHAVDQYQSKASGADIKYKMGQKAINGGTITRAPLGYLNIQIEYQERRIRTVELDTSRAALVAQAFELYGTGQYSGGEVLDQITAAGLRTRPSKRGSGKPLSLNRLYQILSDRYYLGIVEYDGQEYPGRHEPIVTAELFERVQKVFALRGGGGTRQRRHNHYLKGTLWCWHCRQRFVISPGRGNGGTYFYFVCLGRHRGTCRQPYLRVEELEQQVIRHYATVQLGDPLQTELRRLLDDAMLTELGSLDALRRQQTARLAELDAKEDQYLDLVGDPGWPQEKLRRKLDGITAERARITEQLADTGSKLDIGRRFFLAALDLLSDPRTFYEHAGTSVRQAMNKVIFTKLWVQNGEITGHEPTATMAPLLAAHRALRARRAIPAPRQAGTNAKSPRRSAEALDQVTEADLLALVLTGQGSNKPVLVGDTGIEPVTSSV